MSAIRTAAALALALLLAACGVLLTPECAEFAERYARCLRRHPGQPAGQP